MKKKLAIAAFGAFLAVTPAQAASPWYVSAAGGFSLMRTVDAYNSAVGADAAIKSRYGYAVNGAIGYDFGNSLRAEAELGHSRNEIYSVHTPSINNTTALEGKFADTTLLLSAYYDFHNPTPFTPYVGAGAGVLRRRMQIIVPIVSSDEQGDEMDTVFAYQASAGVSYKIMPQATVFTGYRYLGGQDTTHTTHVNNVKSVTEVSNHQLTFGVRVGF